MATFAFDWPYVRRHTLLPTVSACIMAVALASAIWMHGDQNDQFASFSQRYDTVRRDFDKLLAEQRMVQRYEARYQRLQRLGIIGPESRLDWIETMRTTAESLSLPRVTYSIDPQLEVTAPVRSAARNNDMKIRVSHAELQLGVSHEYDVLRFFDELQRSAPGLIKVDECDLSWRADLSEGLFPGSNLGAQCSVQIYSVTTSEFATEDAS